MSLSAPCVLFILYECIMCKCFCISTVFSGTGSKSLLSYYVRLHLVCVYIWCADSCVTNLMCVPEGPRMPVAEREHWSTACCLCVCVQLASGIYSFACSLWSHHTDCFLQQIYARDEAAALSSLERTLLSLKGSGICTRKLPRGQIQRTHTTKPHLHSKRDLSIQNGPFNNWLPLVKFDILLYSTIGVLWNPCKQSVDMS